MIQQKSQDINYLLNSGLSKTFINLKEEKNNEANSPILEEPIRGRRQVTTKTVVYLSDPRNH